MGKMNAPILVLGTKADFSLYTCEILKAEGLNAFDVCLLPESKMSFGELHSYDVVILGASEIPQELADSLKDYVEKGGSLIAFSPDEKLAEVFGAEKIPGILADAYVKLDGSRETGRDLAGEALQFHGAAELYSLKGAVEIAGLYRNKTAPCGYPAAALYPYGKGSTIIFAYNLPLSILLTRQGNPELAGSECDGINGLRAMDMFTGGWVDLGLNHINQADQQMQFLSRCIEYLCINKKPLPRLWYFPDRLKSLAILTNDGEDSCEADFVPQFDAIESRGARMSLYVKETGLISREKVQEWVKRGHEISGHPDDTREAENPQWENKCRVYGEIARNIDASFGLPMLTNVNHWFVWCGTDERGTVDFTAEAKLEEKFGIQMDLNYAHYDNGSNQGRFLGAPGNFTGSGLPMRFADMHGNIVDVYQVLTNVYDQLYMENKDPDGFFNCFKTLLDRSLEQEIFSVVGVKAHNDEWSFSREPVMKMLEYAESKDIPVWTAQRLLQFLQRRDGARFAEIQLTERVLNFALECPLGSEGLTAMVPYVFDGKTVDNMSSEHGEIPFKVWTIKGVQYAVATLEGLSACNIKVAYA